MKSLPKNKVALQTVQVQCDTKEVSHLCIFPSDGTNRIRFTGLGSDPTLSRLLLAPRRLICSASNFIISDPWQKSSPGYRTYPGQIVLFMPWFQGAD